MHTITKQYRTETGHRLNRYDGKCSHLHGHSYLWEVTAASGWLDEKGMVADFKDLKTALVTALEPLDHAMVLADDDPLLQKARDMGVRIEDLLIATNGKEPRLHIWPGNPTAESFAEYAYKMINMNCPRGVRVVSVKVWETATSFAEYSAP